MLFQGGFLAIFPNQLISMCSSIIFSLKKAYRRLILSGIESEDKD